MVFDLLWVRQRAGLHKKGSRKAEHNGGLAMPFVLR